jgi:capping protein beta
VDVAISARDQDADLPLYASPADAFSATQDLLRRLPPTNITKNTETLCALLPDLAEDLVTAIDQPLLVKTDASKEYLCTEYNKDGDSYR